MKTILLHLSSALLAGSLPAFAGTNQPIPPPEPRITVHADKKLFTLSDLMIGANMEDLHYQMVGGIDSQLLHGESFYEPSPTQLAPETGLIAGFDNCGGSVTLENGELVLGKGTRLTSKTDASEANIELKPTDGAGLAICINPNNADNGWEWYTGYTAVIEGNRILLTKSERASKPQEVASTPFPASDWMRLGLRLDGDTVRVTVDGKEVIAYHDRSPLPPGHWAVVARGPTQLGGAENDKKQGAQPEAAPPRFRGPFEPNPLLKTPGDAVSLRWQKLATGSAKGTFALTTEGAWFTNPTSQTNAPNHGTHGHWHGKNKPIDHGYLSQTITFTGGEGEWGIDNAGLKRWGINLVAGKPYEGYLRVKSAQPTELWVSLRKADGTVVAEQKLEANGNYQRLAFTLTPSASDEKGRFAITLRKPGSVTLGYAFLQPGEWGRFKGLPIRKDFAEALLGQGIRILRFNGGMIEVPGYRWKNMRGPRDERRPYDGFYDRYCSSGFGPAEAVAFGKAAGIPVVPGLNIDETPEGFADFAATCRPQFLQVANETGINRHYVDKFKQVAEAVWKVAPDITLVTVSKFGAATPLDTELAAFAREHGKRILFDCHSFNGAGAVKGAAGFARWLKEREPQAEIGVLELNAGAFDFQRGLNHALEMNEAYRQGDVIRSIGMPNVSQPWGIYQTDWKAVLWTQGNIYYTPSKVWFQPAYYVDQMIANSWAPEAVAVEAPATLDAFAAKTADGSKVVLRVVNNTGKEQPVTLDWQGISPVAATARVTTLAHANLQDINTESEPEKIKPVTGEEPSSKHVFPPNSFTVIEMPVKP
jgi:hypothetical protein